jgi:copper oxidase (laccase) domain-containing protein
MEPELEQYNFGDDIVAFSTTRHGGVSKGNYAELNINPYCGDDPKDVSANLKTLCDALEITTDHLILPHQTHQTVCRAITPEYFDLSNEKRKEYLEGVDAVMTDMPKVCVGVSTADCIPYSTTTRSIMLLLPYTPDGAARWLALLRKPWRQWHNNTVHNRAK